MKRILCLDFDGVICDSNNETMLVTYNCYRYLKDGKWPSICRLEDIPETFSRFFLQYRYLVRPAGEYWALIHALEQFLGTLNQNIFDEIVSRNKASVTAFEPTFFTARQNIQNHDMNYWLSLHRLYPQFSDGWEEVDRTFEVYVVSNKNLPAVGPLLNHFQIEIPKERLYTNERMKRKNRAIEAIARENHVIPDAIFFVDDHPLHIDDVERTGARCFLATWGYYNETAGDYDPISNIKELCSR